MSGERGWLRRIPTPPEVLRAMHRHSRETRDRRLRAGRAIPRTRRERELYARRLREEDDEDEKGRHGVTPFSGR